MVPEGGQIVPGADGNAVIPEGTKLTAVSAKRGEETLFPFFTRPSRARAWFTGDHIVMPDRPRDLFARHPDTPFLLNPGSDYGKKFASDEVKRLLAGDLGEGVDELAIPAGRKILLSHPKEIPAELIAALAREFASTSTVRGAWLLMAMGTGRDAPSWMLGIDQNGSWQTVLDAITRAVSGDMLKGRVLDAMPLDGSQMSATLRGGIPIMAAPPKRGFLQNLFR
jgi:hypothetical protein